ncbi:MAG: hypothetical protein CVT64_11945 [Actinobacteria bacterium HGW-Actinobacteria-4]|nr:MAG: hypothetical protein CVT64_11945 [Actinobacteria bacterium HGW-Actinobacteria-4]
MNASRTRAPLVYLSRGGRHRLPSIRVGAPLPPRSLFKGNKELLAAYDAYVKLDEARRSHMDKATAARTAIPAASDEYRQTIAKAIAAGEETGSVIDPERELLATAQAHDKLALDAEHAATQQGYTLAALICEAAPGVFEALEQEMEQAAVKIRTAVASIDGTWHEWSAAWRLRTLLGRAHLYGGELSDFMPDAGVPAEVVAARGAIQKQLGVLDAFKAEEQEVAAFRAEHVKGEE